MQLHPGAWDITIKSFMLREAFSSRVRSNCESRLLIISDQWIELKMVKKGHAVRFCLPCSLSSETPLHSRGEKERKVSRRKEHGPCGKASSL